MKKYSMGYSVDRQDVQGSEEDRIVGVTFDAESALEALKIAYTGVLIAGGKPTSEHLEQAQEQYHATYEADSIEDWGEFILHVQAKNREEADRRQEPLASYELLGLLDEDSTLIWPRSKYFVVGKAPDELQAW